MRLQDILHKCKSGEWTIDMMGHDVPCLEERLFEWLDFTEKHANGEGDGSWYVGKDETVEQVNVSMRKSFQNDLDKNLELGEPVPYGDPTYSCNCCDKRLRFSLGEKSIIFSHYWDGKQYSITPRCKYEIPRP